MGRIILTITNANNNLLKYNTMIEKAVGKAEHYAFNKLKIDWDINLVITNRIYEFIIPEDGVGGRTYTSDFIVMGIDEEKITEEILSEAIVHELCHAARWGKNDEWMNTLFDGIINEGIATCFGAEFVKNRARRQFFLDAVAGRSDEENLKIYEVLSDSLGDCRYDYQAIFFNGNDDLPRWAGYSLGYYVVKKYLEHSGKTIFEAFSDRYSEIEAVMA